MCRNCLGVDGYIQYGERRLGQRASFVFTHPSFLSASLREDLDTSERKKPLLEAVEVSDQGDPPLPSWSLLSTFSCYASV